MVGEGLGGAEVMGQERVQRKETADLVVVAGGSAAEDAGHEAVR